jgi:hypothetical protein
MKFGRFAIVTLSAALIASIPLATGAADKDKIIFKPLEAVILRIDDRAPKLWNIFKPDKKDMFLLQLGQRFLMIDVKERRVFELESQKLEHKGNELIWNDSDKPDAPLATEEWTVREVGFARRIKFKLSTEGRVVDIQIPIPIDQRTRSY